MKFGKLSFLIFVVLLSFVWFFVVINFFTDQTLYSNIVRLNQRVFQDKSTQFDLNYKVNLTQDFYIPEIGSDELFPPVEQEIETSLNIEDIKTVIKNSLWEKGITRTNSNNESYNFDFDTSNIDFIDENFLKAIISNQLGNNTEITILNSSNYSLKGTVQFSKENFSLQSVVFYIDNISIEFQLSNPTIDQAVNEVGLESLNGSVALMDIQLIAKIEKFQSNINFPKDKLNLLVRANF